MIRQHLVQQLIVGDRGIVRTEFGVRGCLSQIEVLRSIGPRTAALLREAGIVTVSRFQELGPIVTFRLLREVDQSVGLPVLWRLESAFTNTPIREITDQPRAELLRMIGGHPSASSSSSAP